MAKYSPKTYVGFVIDRSGSMSSVHHQAIEAHNQQLHDIRQAAEDQEVEVVRTIFDFPDQIDITGPMPLKEVPDLTAQTYVPRGSTALNDAIGLTIQKLRQFKLRKKDAVLLVIITDGWENSSQHYSNSEIKTMLEGLEETNQWTVTYLGANVDVSQVAWDYGIPLSNMAAFASTPAGVNTMSSNVTPATTDYFHERERGVTSSKTFLNANEGEAADYTKV